MTRALQFTFGNRTYRFVSVDALEDWILQTTYRARQLGDAMDVELNLDKKQAYLEELAQLQQALWRAGDLLNAVEGGEVKL